MAIQVVEIADLRPTQMSVGYALVKFKRAGLESLRGRPSELVNFILEHPIRAVLGPKKRVYVIDHHHLGLALEREKFLSAPVDVSDDFSAHSMADFWGIMAKRGFMMLTDAEGQRHPVSSLPKRLGDLADDPYRSLAGFVRLKGGFLKTQQPYMEFQWADYFRPLILEKDISRNMDAAIKKAMALVHLPAAAHLPGYIPPPAGTR
ncbi:ParB-like protein [Aestuariivirga sp.]|uniref:ParB-like protein n=1 Tax=Aestuariivirga sp. TaxID=2650926 RepID=UPI0039E5DD67